MRILLILVVMIFGYNNSQAENYLNPTSDFFSENTLTITSSITPADCCNDNGTISLTVSGGDGNYTYSWQDNISTTDSAQNLAPGNYKVTVTDGTICSQVGVFDIVRDCAACGDYFDQQDTLIVPEGVNPEVCAHIPFNDRNSYGFILDGSTYVPPATQCNLDTLVFYTYALLQGLGSDGPYRLDSWDCNGITLENIVIQDMDDLTALMNANDPNGNWVNDAATFTIRGGNAQDNYADVVITHLGTSIQATIQTNYTGFANGSLLELDNAPGLHELIATDPSICCTDTFYYLIPTPCALDISSNVTNTGCCRNDGAIDLTVTGGTGNYSYEWTNSVSTTNVASNIGPGEYFITVTDDAGCSEVANFGVEIDCDNCPEIFPQDTVYYDFGEDVVVCVPIPFAERTGYNIILDGNSYTQPTTQCDVDTIVFYTYALLVGLGSDGPYRVDNWTCNGVTVVDSIVQDMPELVALMNEVDPSGNWANDPSTFTISGGSDEADYSDLIMTHLGTNIEATIQTNFTGVANGFEVDIPDDTGTYFLDIENATDCCFDVLAVIVSEPATLEDTINYKINVNEDLENQCMPWEKFFASGFSEMTICGEPSNGLLVTNGVDECVNYYPNQDYVGLDEFCVIVCNNNGLCGTITIQIEVCPLTITPDSLYFTTPFETPVTDICVDLDELTAANVLLQPCAIASNGSLNFVGDNECVNYFPAPGFEGMDEFCLEVCDEEGVCDTTYVFITVLEEPTNMLTPDTVNLQTAFETTIDDICILLNELTTAPETMTFCQAAANGTVVIDNNNQCVDYTPSNGFSGNDEFCLVACDSTGVCDLTYVFVEITPPVCNDFIADENVLITDCFNEGAYCFDIPLDQIHLYSITDNGSTYNGLLEGCNFDTTFSYNYLTIPSSGAQGPYSLDSWEFNDSIYTGMGYLDMATFVAQMNIWDTTGNWILDMASFTIRGGDAANTYGTIDLTQDMTNATGMMNVNIEMIPGGTQITLNEGIHNFILTEDNTNCVDSIEIIVDCPEMVDTINNVVVLDSLIQLCMDDFGVSAEVVSITNTCSDESGENIEYTVDENTGCLLLEGLTIGSDTACIEICFDSGMCGTTVVITGAIPLPDCNPVFTTDEMTVTSANCFQPVDVCLDDLTFENSALYDLTIIANMMEMTDTFDECDDGSGNAQITELFPGDYQIIIDHKFIECSDTLDLTVDCVPATVTPEIITDTIDVNTSGTICMDLGELQGTPTTLTNECEDQSGEYVLFSIPNSNLYCVQYTAVEAGEESACYVVCDDLGICDTTYIIVTVLGEEIEDDGLPIAVNDVDTTAMNSPILIYAMANDTVNTSTDTLYVLDQPTNGVAVGNNTGLIEYTPNPDYCDETEGDEFTYVICDDNSCDTATVTVYVFCNEIEIYTGFSPNGDGINDVFRVNGIEAMTNNDLCIFNRWGTQVFYTKDYQNDWNGEFNGSTLPDGTYFYIFNDGIGNTFTGYVQIHR